VLALDQRRARDVGRRKKDVRKVQILRLIRRVGNALNPLLIDQHKLTVRLLECGRIRISRLRRILDPHSNVPAGL